MKTLIGLLLGLAALAPINSSAKDRDPSAGLTISQCSGLIRECLAYSDDRRLSCFYAAGHHAFCAGSDLGALALKRYSYGPSEDTVEAPSLLGPQLVDVDCIANFDNRLSGSIIQEPLTENEISRLSTSLDSCKKGISNEIMRP